MKNTLTKGYSAKLKLDEVKHLMKRGDITYDDAVAQAKPFLAILNAEMTRVSKEFGRKHYAVTFSKYMR